MHVPLEFKNAFYGISENDCKFLDTWKTVDGLNFYPWSSCEIHSSAVVNA